MQQQDDLKFTSSVFMIPGLYVFIIWLLYWIEINYGFNFNKLGVFPRTLSGLKGAFLMHFIHSDANHLFSNSVPLFVLLSSLYYFYRNVAFKVLFFGGIITGLSTWLIARNAFHIGASGIVYLLFSFVFFSGIFKKHFRLVALSLIVIFLYGSMIWYVLPIKEGMSWEGHLSGFLVGLVFAIFYRKKGIVKKEIQFEETEFDLLFDENGSFSPPKIENDIEEEDNLQ